MLRLRGLNRVRIALVTGVVALVAAATVYQGQIEAGASVQLHEAESGLAAELAHATEIGLTGGELAPFKASQQALTANTPPLALLFFNSQRIGFFERKRRAATQDAADLRELEAMITRRSRDEATTGVQAVRRLFDRATEVGADPEAVIPLAPAMQQIQSALERAVWPKDHRPLKAWAQQAAEQMESIVRAQEAENARVAQLATEAAAVNRGDLGLARRQANEALAAARFELQSAELMAIGVGRLRWRVDQAAEQLQKAQTLADVERATATLRFRDARLLELLEASAPEKVITISLAEQRVRAYERGKVVWWSFVTTGRPGLGTDTGTWKILRKNANWTMHSPWPKELPGGQPNPFWYPDTPVKTVMWFTDSGEGLHDAPWRSIYGPGTNVRHSNDPGAPDGTHGCVNVPASLMPWLWDWTAVGTPVIVY